MFEEVCGRLACCVQMMLWVYVGYTFTQRGYKPM